MLDARFDSRLGELALSYKVSVDSVGDTGADDVLIAFIDVVFRETTFASWAVFGLAVFLPVCLSIVFWLSDQFLGAAMLSATAMLVVLGRILGLSREKSSVPAEEPEEIQVQA